MSGSASWFGKLPSGSKYSALHLERQAIEQRRVRLARDAVARVDHRAQRGARGKQLEQAVAILCPGQRPQRDLWLQALGSFSSANAVSRIARSPDSMPIGTAFGRTP